MCLPCLLCLVAVPAVPAAPGLLCLLCLVAVPACAWSQVPIPSTTPTAKKNIWDMPACFNPCDPLCDQITFEYNRTARLKAKATELKREERRMTGGGSSFSWQHHPTG